jgi:hypothetical protein
MLTDANATISCFVIFFFPDGASFPHRAQIPLREVRRARFTAMRSTNST